MDTVSVNLSAQPAGKYPVWIGSGLLKRFGELIDVRQYSRTIIISDETVAGLHAERLRSSLTGPVSLLVVPPGEAHKNIHSAELLWNGLLQEKADRRSLIVNLGGGVIGDLGGFVADTFMRGVTFVQVPTTLLSQVDASVGGKLGIDFASVKNLVGSFGQPKAVLIDTETLKTLPEREFRSGLAEIIKHGLIRDAEYFSQVVSKLSENGLGLQSGPEKIGPIITRSVQIKAETVGQDPEEAGLRKILNFGHTVGHGLESISLESEAPLLHGEAISLGMLVEARISEAMKLITQEDVETIEAALTTCGLPTKTKLKFSDQEFTKRILTDKKNRGGVVKWSLLSGIGRCRFDLEVPHEKVLSALSTIRTT